jgi:hypothetical protein
MGDSMISNKSEKEHQQVFLETLESKPVESQEHLEGEQHIQEAKDEEKQEEGNDFDAFGDLAS